MATKKIAKEKISVRTKKGTERRCRAGECFGETAKSIEVTPDQLKAIQADEFLIIE